MQEPAPTEGLITTNRKALSINLDGRLYGTIAEIGAGQEVARIFFQAGGASGSIAKTMSAYDMTVSDAIYGKAPRYVSRERLVRMLSHEYDLLHERLAKARGDSTKFFVFADTVSAMSFKGGSDCHGWMGVRYQSEPNSEASEIVLHVRMWDRENLAQQEALGIVGINLVYGAFNFPHDPKKLLQSLADNLSAGRIEIDMLHCTGPAFRGVDNRLLALYLVQTGLTNAVMFGPDGDVLQPSEVLYKRPVLVERGSFRPITHVNVDMLNCAAAQFIQEPMVKNKDVVILLEITMNNLLAEGEIDTPDFLSRVDMLAHSGFTTLISNYSEFYRLVSYFRRYTKEMVGVAMGINTLTQIFDDKYYGNLEGGILESFGRLFRHAVKLYAYPMRPDAFDRYMAVSQVSLGAAPVTSQEFVSQVLITAKNLQVAQHLSNLYAHLLENHCIDGIVGFEESCLSISSRDVLQYLRAGDSRWEAMVPRTVADFIKSRRLFGYLPTLAANAAVSTAA